MSGIKLIGGALAALGIATNAAAHNSWIIADKSSVEPGSTVRVALATAHETFPESEHATDPDRVAAWVVRHGNSHRPLSHFAVDGLELATRVRLDDPGTYAIGVALKPRFIEIGAEEFQQYLAEEHAQAALAARNARGDQDKPGRERYTKLAKTFVRVGPGDRAYLEPLGHPLEIVPLSDPSTWTVEHDIEVRVLFEGRPAAGLHVSTGHESGSAHDYVQAVRTGAAGTARLRFDRPGHWLVRTQIIRPAGSEQAAGEPAADWESYWASVTVLVGPSAGPR